MRVQKSFLPLRCVTPQISFISLVVVIVRVLVRSAASAAARSTRGGYEALLDMTDCFSGGLPLGNRKSRSPAPEGPKVARRAALGSPRERAAADARLVDWKAND